MITLNRTRLLGHRGASHEALENSLLGFEHAHRLQTRGLSGIELDVQLTADGHLVVFHDETLVRLCGLQSRIDQLTLHEIKRHLQSGQQIMTLDKLAQALIPAMPIDAPKTPSTARPQTQQQALARLFNTSSPIASVTDKHHPNHEHEPSSNEAATPILPTQKNLTAFSHIELEIKTHDRTNYPKLTEALGRYLLDSPLSDLPIVLTSFDVQLHAQLQRHKRLCTIARGLLVRSPSQLSSAPNTALQLGCTHLGVHYPLLTQSLIALYHRYDLSVSAWTVNDIDIAKQLVAWQVDVIVTDIPMQLL